MRKQKREYIGKNTMIKKIVYAILGGLAVIALGVGISVVRAEQTARASVVFSTSVTNAAKVLSGTGLGPDVEALIIDNSAGTATVGVAFASSTLAASPITLTPGDIAIFPSATYDFVPGGTMYAIGGAADVTNTLVVSALVK